MTKKYFFWRTGQIYTTKKCNSMTRCHGTRKKVQTTPADAGRKRGTMEPSKYITEAELAKILKVSKSTLYKLREDGSLPFQMIGTCIRYSTEEIEKWLETHSFNQGRVE